MATQSIKKNFAYNSVLTLSSYVMAFITFPYVSRILGVNKIGLVDFVDNTIAYFLLFGSMGVSILGVREIAAVKENCEERDRVYSNIFGLNLCFTIVILIAYLILIYFIPKLNQYSELFYIGSAKIVFTLFLSEWFFAGTENFRYITLRSLIVKTLYVISVFIFIKSPNDYKLYFILSVSSVVLNAIVNFVYVNKIVHFNVLHCFSTKFLKRNIVLGIYNIMTSMYLTFNVMFLGFVANNTQVGYYTTAYKVYTVTLGFFTAFTGVMIPRMSSLLANGEMERFKELIDKSFRAMCTFSLPIIICAIVLSPQIIYVLSGPGYEGAITPMRIIMPAALFVGIAQVIAKQVLTPMKKDNVLFKASLIGAFISIIINIILVSRLQSMGSAIVLLCSEIAVTGTYVVFVLKHSIIIFPFSSIWKNLLFAAPACVVCLICQCITSNPYIILCVSIPISVVTWWLFHKLITNVSFV